LTHDRPSRLADYDAIALAHFLPLTAERIDPGGRTPRNRWRSDALRLSHRTLKPRRARWLRDGTLRLDGGRLRLRDRRPNRRTLRLRHGTLRLNGRPLRLRDRRLNRWALRLRHGTLRLNGRPLRLYDRALGLNDRLGLGDRALRPNSRTLRLRHRTLRLNRRTMWLGDRALLLSDGPLRPNLAWRLRTLRLRHGTWRSRRRTLLRCRWSWLHRRTLRLRDGTLLLLRPSGGRWLGPCRLHALAWGRPPTRIVLFRRLLLRHNNRRLIAAVRMGRQQKWARRNNHSGQQIAMFHCRLSPLCQLREP
jgi:hypothetical protein